MALHLSTKRTNSQRKINHVTHSLASAAGTDVPILTIEGSTVYVDSIQLVQRRNEIKAANPNVDIHVTTVATQTMEKKVRFAAGL